MRIQLASSLYFVIWSLLITNTIAFYQRVRIGHRWTSRCYSSVPLLDQEVNIPERPREATIFAYAVESIGSPGTPIKLLQYHGKKAYVAVNIATQSDIAVQHLSELQTLYDRYKDAGLEILAFPSDTFGNEPDSNNQIIDYLTNNLKITFPVFGKLMVQNGIMTHPLYKYLSKSVGNGFLGPDLRRDFVRFLCDYEGEVVKRYHPNTSPLSMEPRIKVLLDAKQRSQRERITSDNFFGAFANQR